MPQPHAEYSSRLAARQKTVATKDALHKQIGNAKLADGHPRNRHPVACAERRNNLHILARGSHSDLHRASQSRTNSPCALSLTRAPPSPSTNAASRASKTAGPAPAHPANASAIRNTCTPMISTSSAPAASSSCSPPRCFRWAKNAWRSGSHPAPQCRRSTKDIKSVVELRDKLDLREELAAARRRPEGAPRPAIARKLGRNAATTSRGPVANRLGAVWRFPPRPPQFTCWPH